MFNSWRARAYMRIMRANTCAHTYIKFVRYDIDNTPGQKQTTKGKRSFRPTSTLIFDLFRSLAEKLKDCGLANKHHNVLLARGASWLKSTKGVCKQTPHR